MDTSLPVTWLRRFGRLLAAVVVLSCGFWFVVAHPADQGIPLTEGQRLAVVQAIQDEMYDEGCQGWVPDLADQEKDNNIYQMHVYIPHELGPQGSQAGSKESNYNTGWLIYKLMPIGEVYREFWFRDDGLAVLGGHPQWDFPPTEPSYLTVYMGDDQLTEYKHDWTRTSFSLELDPAVERLREAAARQKVRRDGDYRAHKRDCTFSWR